MNQIGTLSGIENFVDMFLVKDVFIELTLHLFEFPLSESDGFVMIPSSIKSLVEVKGVEKNIVDFDVECLFIDCQLQLVIIFSFGFYTVLVRTLNLQYNLLIVFIVMIAGKLFKWIKVESHFDGLFSEQLVWNNIFSEYL